MCILCRSVLICALCMCETARDEKERGGEKDSCIMCCVMAGRNAF